MAQPGRLWQCRKNVHLKKQKKQNICVSDSLLKQSNTGCDVIGHVKIFDLFLYPSLL